MEIVCLECFELFDLDDGYKRWMDEVIVICPNCNAPGTVIEINDDSFALQTFIEVEAAVE